MATAEQILHEAHYAFHNISFGESKENRRNHRRATSLCKKIIRKYPTSKEATEAHAILRRLGEEAYTSQLSIVHRHPQPGAARKSMSARPSKPLVKVQKPSSQRMTSAGDGTVPLDWRGLWSVLSKMRTAAWVVAAFVLAVLYEFFGVLLLLPLLALFLFTGPFRGLLQPKQRREMNQFVIQANTWIDERLRNNA